MKVHIIKAPAGLGKTSRVVESLRTAAFHKAEIYLPTHALATEISAALGTGANPVSNVVTQGRSREVTPGQFMCKKHVQAAELSSKGWPVTPLLCERSEKGAGRVLCEHHHDCPYIKQFYQGERVRIYTHASLSRPRGVLEGEAPDLAIIDESFWSSCISVSPIGLANLFDTAMAQKLDATGQTTSVLKLVGEAVQRGLPLLKHLRKSNAETVIKAAVAEIRGANGGLAIRPTQGPQDQKAATDRLPRRKEILSLLEALENEIKVDRDESHSVTWVPDRQLIHVCYRHPITRFDKDAKVLILDANADQTIIGQWFPGVTFVDIPASRNAFVIQCNDSRVSTTSLVPERNADPVSAERAEGRLRDLEVLIAREAPDDRRVLVVGPQAVMGNPAQKQDSLISVGPNVVLAHFGGIRGLDLYKSFDTVIVIGRNEPPVKSVEAQARAIYFDHKDALLFADDWVAQERGYRLRNTDEALGIEVPVHPDPLIQGVVEQIRESETTQAIDRLRHVHSPTKKRVFIVSSNPVNIEVDVLIGWQDMIHGSRLIQALNELDHGVLPLVPDWLAERFPALWRSPAAAREDIRKARQTGGLFNNISINNSTSLDYDFWVAGQKRPSRACSLFPMYPTQTELTKLLGAAITIREGKDLDANPKWVGAFGKGVMLPFRSWGFASCGDPTRAEVQIAA